MAGAPFMLCLLLLGGCGSRPDINLVLISMDTTRADHIGAYGYAQASTPVIDGLARQGFLFRNHLTPVPITLPAHTSMFTGLFPPSHTVRDNGTFVVPPEAVTLAEVLADHGYATAAFIGGFPLSKQFGIDQGFAHYDDRLDREAGKNVDPTRPTDRIFFDERPATEVVDAAIAYHREHPCRPFFTFLHFFDPHQPLKPPAPYDIEFRDRPYDGEIAYVDEQIGRFLAFLRERGELERTLVVVTGDHGEGLGEHGELTHSTLLHQATLHVPLVFYGPGVVRGETQSWTSSTELYATVLDLLGVRYESAGDPPGRSLAPLMANKGVEPPGWTPFESYFETIAPRATQGASQLTGWMDGNNRLVYGPKPELYDLGRDPHETDNLYAREPALAKELFQSLRGFLATHEKRSVGAAARGMDEETMQRLAGLGYAQFDAKALQGLDDMLKVEGLIDPKDRVVDVSLYSEARAALFSGDIELALSLHQALVKRSPDNANAHSGLALLYAQIGDRDKALEHLDAALRANPKDVKLLKQRGWLLVEMGRYKEALDLLLAQSQTSLGAADCIWIATAYQRSGAAREASKWFAKCVPLAEDNPWMRLLYANQLATLGEFDAAEPLYRWVVAANPYFAIGFFNYGKMLLDRGEPEQAKLMLQRAARLAPGHRPTRKALQLLAGEASAH
jgi:choline-sulfatase